MSTQTAAPPAITIHPVSFVRVVRSEWLKLWSLRSTYWALGATLVAMILMSLLMAVGAATSAENPEFGPGPDGTMVIGFSYFMAQLVIAVLGVLMISGEYSTGMIRSTLAAVPTRLPVLAAYAIIITVVAFVTGVLGVLASYVITMPMLSNAGGAADLGDPEVLRLVWGTGLYLAAVGLLGLGIGALLRHSAGAIATVLGIILLLPMIVQLAMGPLEWLRDAYPYLPSVAGEQIVAIDSPDMDAMGMPAGLEPWTGFGVLIAYVAVVHLAAALLLRRRDA